MKEQGGGNDERHAQVTAVFHKKTKIARRGL